MVFPHIPHIFLKDIGGLKFPKVVKKTSMHLLSATIFGSMTSGKLIKICASILFFPVPFAFARIGSAIVCVMLTRFQLAPPRTSANIAYPINRRRSLTHTKCVVEFIRAQRGRWIVCVKRVGRMRWCHFTSDPECEGTAMPELGHRLFESMPSRRESPRQGLSIPCRGSINWILLEYHAHTERGGAAGEFKGAFGVASSGM